MAIEAEEITVVRDMRTEGLLKEWGIEAELDEAFPLARLEIRDTAQVRATENRAPRETAEEFALQMSHGAVYPPIVATKSGILIDGNTRRVAARAIGRTTFPTYLIKLPRQDYAPMIGAALNQTGGLRLTSEEAFAAASIYINAGFTDDNIARHLGKSRPSVSNYRKQHAFKEKAERLGIADVKVSKVLQRHLGDIAMDAPFVAATKSAADNKFTEKQARELVEQIGVARSEGEQLDIIDAYGQKHPGSGPKPRKKNTTAPAMKARTHVRALLGYSAAELAPPTLRDELEPEWQELGDLVDRVLTAFEEGGVQGEIGLEGDA